jgi:hypothetical protein
MPVFEKKEFNFLYSPPQSSIKTHIIFFVSKGITSWPPYIGKNEL